MRVYCSYKNSRPSESLRFFLTENEKKKQQNLTALLLKFSAKNVQRSGGNGACSGNVEEESRPVAMATAPPPTLSAATEQKQTQGHVKTPKLSRFFSSARKRSKSPASKRSVATPPLPNEVKTSFVTINAMKASPKNDKRSKHQSPCKTQLVVTSKSDKDKPKSGKSPKKSSKVIHARIISRQPVAMLNETIAQWQADTKKGDVKSYGFSYDNCQSAGSAGGASQPVASAGPASGTSTCPSEGYESGGSDSGVHLSAASPVKNRGGRSRLMPIGETSGARVPKTFSSGTSTSGSGGSAGSAASTAGHYESSGYESVIRDSECSSLGSSGSDRDLPLGGGAVVPTKLSGPAGNWVEFLQSTSRSDYCYTCFFSGQSSSCNIL